MKRTQTSSRLTLLAALIAAATLSAACSSTAVKPAESATATSIQAPQVMAPVASIESDTRSELSIVTPAPESTVEESTLMEPADFPTQESSATLEHLNPTDDTTRPARLTFNFDFNQAKLDAENQKIIEEHGRFLAEHPEIKMVINGHSDAQGDSHYNEALSLKRAEYVADLLMSQGATKEQIETFSWGSTVPLADAHKNRDQRRVELKYADEYFVQASTEQATSTPEVTISNVSNDI